MTDLALIMQPVAALVVPGRSSAGSGLENVLTPNPREGFLSSSANPGITIDLVPQQMIDTVFIGFTTAPAGQSVRLYIDNATVPVAVTVIGHSYRRSPLRHAVVCLDLPVTASRVRVVIDAAAGAAIGVLAAGLSIRPSGGHDWGSGRPVVDAGRADRLADGAFGIMRGGRAGGWQWTMPALTDEERDRLYALALDAGTTETVLVCEGGDMSAAGANERLHWGLLTKLEPYGRQSPGISTWSMQVQDWS